MQIEPGMVVRNVVNGGFYVVRSVSRTKAVGWPCTRRGKRYKYMGNAATEMDQARLRIVRVRTEQK